MTVEGPLLASFSCGKVNFEKYDVNIIFVDMCSQRLAGNWTEIHTVVILNTYHKYHLQLFMHTLKIRQNTGKTKLLRCKQHLAPLWTLNILTKWAGKNNLNLIIQVPLLVKIGNKITSTSG